MLIWLSNLSQNLQALKTDILTTLPFVWNMLEIGPEVLEKRTKMLSSVLIKKQRPEIIIIKDWLPVDFFVVSIVLYHIPAWVCSSSKSPSYSLSTINNTKCICLNNQYLDTEMYYFVVDHINLFLWHRRALYPLKLAYIHAHLKTN